jgi:hypothetical protein
MIKDSMRSADLCSLTASNPDRIKDPIHRDKWINAFPIMNLMTVHILGNGKKNRLASDDDYAGSTPQRSL